MKVLLVEDDPIVARMLTQTLQKWSYEVVRAGDGVEGEARLADEDIGMVITDWQMPRMDGVELCKRVRAMTRPRYTPIIMLTSRRETKDLVDGLEAGADAFLKKPLSLPELHAHMRVVQRVIDLENNLAEKVSELDLLNHKMSEDLESAGRIQRSLLPSTPLQLPWLESDWRFDACSATAGDMLNVMRLDEHRVGFYVLDVSGHGTQAALLSVSLSRVLTPFAQQGGLLKATDTNGYRVLSPAEVAGELNRRFPVMKQSGQYFTFIYGIVDRRTRMLSLVSAGHPHPIILSKDGARLHQPPGNIPIGWMPNTHFQDQEIQLASGDQVVFYTDGYSEAKDPNGQEFGEQRMLHVLNAGAGGTVRESVAALKLAVSQFTHHAPQEDDMTLVGVRLV